MQEAAGDRFGEIECSALVQMVVVSADPAQAVATAARRTGLSGQTVIEPPFLLFGSVGAIADKVQRLRAELRISHFVVREAEAFAPVVAALAGA